MTPSTLALARRVRALLEAPERWTQGAYARRANGEICNYLDPGAACWCIDGAISREAEGSPDILNAFWVECRDETGDESVAGWNDAPGRTHADVLALLDRVIAEGESRDPPSL